MPDVYEPCFCRASFGALAGTLVFAAEPETPRLSGADSETGHDKRLLLGFEPDEIEGLPADLKRHVADARDVEGQPYRDVQFPTGRSVRKWRLYKGTATQGDYAAGLRYIGRANVEPIRGWYPMPTCDFANRDAVMHYFGMFAGGREMFSTSGLHHLVMPADWSQFDLLRMDVRSEGLTLEYHVSFEDEDILPPIVRSMQGPPEKWVTLEVDLRLPRRRGAWTSPTSRRCPSA